MKKILIIINGVKLPYHLADAAIERAKKNGERLHAVLLKSDQEAGEDYPFPNDLESTENVSSESDLEKDDEKIINLNMELLREKAESEKIDFLGEIKTNISTAELKALSADADVVLLDADFDESAVLGNLTITLKEIKNAVDKPVEVIENIK